LQIPQSSVQTGDYCREIETYLCRKNDGHLMRVVGPSFELVSAWATRGVPLKVAFAGIDRYFERYYSKGARRRPVKIDFCEADVLDVFDEWRRAVGIAIGAPDIDANAGLEVPGENSESRSSNPESPIPRPESRRPSLPGHLERAVLRLTAARAGGSLGGEFDALIDRVSAELDAARAKAGGLRGEARQALLERLSVLDAELLEQAQLALDTAALDAMVREAANELAAFRAGMPAEAFARAQAAALTRLVREHFKLPTIVFL
jgi:hypothetical protein